MVTPGRKGTGTSRGPYTGVTSPRRARVSRSGGCYLASSGRESTDVSQYEGTIGTMQALKASGSVPSRVTSEDLPA
jgi:hypothetical protein